MLAFCQILCYDCGGTIGAEALPQRRTDSFSLHLYPLATPADYRWKGGGRMYVTYEGLFSFMLVMFTAISLVVNIYNNRNNGKK